MLWNFRTAKSSNPSYNGNKRYALLVKESKVEAPSKTPEMPNSKFPMKYMTVVEYSDLLIEDKSLLLKEQVDATMLWPVPPRMEEKGWFEAGDIVDAFDMDGWLTGKVGRVVREEGEEEPRYVVKFTVPEYEIEFGRDMTGLDCQKVVPFPERPSSGGL